MADTPLGKITAHDELDLAIDSRMSGLRTELLRQPGPFSMEVVCAYLRSAYARGYHDALADPEKQDPVVVDRVGQRLLARASLLANRQGRELS